MDDQIYCTDRILDGDTSANKERTIGLVDKACSLFEDVLYSELIDKGLDYGIYIRT